MKKWFLVALLCIAPSMARAVCEPSNATTGMIGCWPAVNTMSLTDSVDIWQPGPFPASANRIHLQNLLRVAPPIGDTTPNTGAFTSLNASLGGALSGTFTGSPTFSGNPNFSGAPTFTGVAPSGSAITALFAAPPSIGNVTRGSAAFTTLSATGAVSGAGFTALFASPPSIGSTAAGAVSSTSGALNGTLGATTRNTARVTTIDASGTSTLSGAITQVKVANFNVGANNVSDCTTQWICSFTFLANAGGSGSPLAGGSNSYMATMNFNDLIYSNGNVSALAVTDSIAPTTSASGARSAFVASLNIQAATGGNTYAASGVLSGGGISVFNSRNLGGTATVYNGGLNGANFDCAVGGPATFIFGCSGVETDTGFGTGTSYGFSVNTLLVTLGTHQVRGLVNDNTMIEIGAQAGAVADIKSGLKFGDQAGANTMDAFGRLIFLSQQILGTTTIAAALDVDNAVPKGCISRAPYTFDCTIQAQSITTATRMTTDGAAASGYLYDAYVSALGSGYTQNQAVTLSNSGPGECSSAAVTVMYNGNGQLFKAGIPTPGTAVKPECVVASIAATGGGSGAAIGLVVAGNSLNFGLNSTIDVQCVVAAYDSAGHSIGWSIRFGASMGATASTTAVIGSPTWTQDFASTGAAAALAISAPAADTTLGAINITVTPTAVTANYGGSCRMTKSART